jgi:hypothetical protein
MARTSRSLTNQRGTSQQRAAPTTKAALVTYVDYLQNQGRPVIECCGIPWMNYNNAVIPASAMPVYVAPSRADALRIVRATGALFLRCSTGRLEREAPWWHVVCREYAFGGLSSKTRARVRRASETLDVRRTSAAWLAKFGHRCHVEFCMHKNMRPQSAAEFASYFEELEKHPIFECWACSRGDVLLGYVVGLREHDGVFMEVFHVTPAGRRAYAGYLMLHTILQHYVRDGALPLSNGTRSVLHPTEMQDFLLKFSFKREFASLLVVYRPTMAVLVRALYPFRNVLESFNRLPVAQKLSAVLRQEEIVRAQRDAAR